MKKNAVEEEQPELIFSTDDENDGDKKNNHVTGNENKYSQIQYQITGKKRTWFENNRIQRFLLKTRAFESCW